MCAGVRMSRWTRLNLFAILSNRKATLDFVLELM